MELPHIKQESSIIIKLKPAAILIAFILILTALGSVPAAAAEAAAEDASNPSYNKLLPLVGGALVEAGTPTRPVKGLPF